MKFSLTPFILVSNVIITSRALEAEILSSSPRVFLYKGFLSDDECAGIITLAKSRKTFNNEQNFSSVYLDSYPDLPANLKEIERRMGAVTGLPPHPEEEPINVHRIKPGDDTGTEINSGGNFTLDTANEATDCVTLRGVRKDTTSCPLMVSSVHHDKVQKEFSYATVLIYLNSVEEGGGTVWPCMARYKSSIVMQPSDACESAFRRGGRWFDGDNAVELGIYSKHRAEDSLHASLQGVLRASHYGCYDWKQQQQWFARPALRTKAQQGDAVVFFHDHLDLSGDSQAWHAGCIPISGEKWTLQKFKELPSSYRESAKSRNELVDRSTSSEL
jgi:hypothetical protein